MNSVNILNFSKKSTAHRFNSSLMGIGSEVWILCLLDPMKSCIYFGQNSTYTIEYLICKMSQTVVSLF